MEYINLLSTVPIMDIFLNFRYHIESLRYIGITPKNFMPEISCI